MSVYVYIHDVRVQGVGCGVKGTYFNRLPPVLMLHLQRFDWDWDANSRVTPEHCFFFTLVTGPRRSLSLKLSDTSVYEPQIRARLGCMV